MKRILLVALIILMCGCSTIRVKKDKGFGHPYEGLTYSSEEWLCIWAISAYPFPPFLLFTFPMGVLDIVSSAVADTIILPIDLCVTNDKGRKKGGKCVGIH